MMIALHIEKNRVMAGAWTFDEVFLVEPAGLGFLGGGGGFSLQTSLSYSA